MRWSTFTSSRALHSSHPSSSPVAAAVCSSAWSWMLWVLRVMKRCSNSSCWILLR